MVSKRFEKNFIYSVLVILNLTSFVEAHNVSTESSLNTAIDLINLGSGDTTISFQNDIPYSVELSPLNATSSDFSFANTTFNIEGNNRVLEMTSGTFKAFFSRGNGGAAPSSPQVSIENLTIMSAISKGGDGGAGSGGGGGALGAGGALFVDTGSHVLLDNVHFQDNQAQGGVGQVRSFRNTGGGGGGFAGGDADSGGWGF